MKKSFKLSVIVPVYNEVKTVEEVILRVLKRKEVFEIIIVDDCSTDGTREILKEYEDKKRVRVLYHTKNQGKGSAILTGLAKATGTHIVIQDADLEYDPQDFELLTSPILEDKAEVVYGSRFLGPHMNMLFWHKLANDILNFMLNILFDTTISDCETGYKLIPVDLLRQLNLKAKRFDFEIEVTCKILKQGIRVYEVPISYSGREYKEGKKITFKDAIIAFGRVLQYRFL